MSALAADTTETMPRGVRMDRYRALGAGAGVKGFTPSGLCLHSWGVYIYIILCVYIYIKCIGALIIIGIGFWGPVYYDYNKEPQIV